MSAADFRKNFAKKYLNETRQLLDSFEEEFLDKIDEIAKVLFKARDGKKTIFVMGNGGSSSTASHFACDLSKGATVHGIPRFRVIALTDNTPSILAWANDSAYGDIFIEQLKNLMSPGDVVIGISGSGNSINVINAIEHANKNGGITVGLSGYDGGKLLRIAKHNIHVKSFCMERVEDIHLLINHLLTCLIREEGKNKLTKANKKN